MNHFAGNVHQGAGDPDGFEMIRTLEIKGYRGLKDFRMEGLGRVNLLLGKNNTGKTSVLEALYLLTSNADPYVLWGLIARRGERAVVETILGSSPTTFSSEVQVAHLFNGHESLTPQSKFTVVTKNDAMLQLTCRVSELVTLDDKGKPIPRPADKPPSFGLVLETPTKKAASSFVNLTPRGTITSNAIETSSRRAGTAVVAEVSKTQFVSTESMGGDELSVAWNTIALTDAEQRVITALKFIDPQVEAIAPILNHMRSGSAFGRSGFIVRQTGKPPVPIGTLGEGVWRTLALVIALSQAKGGLLLVDEIDIGLHYSVMTEMWKLIFKTAKELDIQVFATTHSRDCVESLASICDSDAECDFSIQRLETGRVQAVSYTPDEVKSAARHHIEIR